MGYIQKRWWDLDIEKASTNLHVGKIPGEWDERERRTWLKNTIKDLKDMIVHREMGYISEPIIKTHSPRTGKMYNYMILSFDDQNAANIFKQGWYKFHGQVELVGPYNHEQMWYKDREWKVSLSNLKTPTVRLIELIMDSVVSICVEKGELFEEEYEFRQRDMEGKLLIKATKEAITTIHLDQTDNKVALLTANQDLAELLERHWEDCWNYESWGTEWENFEFAFKFGTMKPESEERKDKGKGQAKGKGREGRRARSGTMDMDMDMDNHLIAFAIFMPEAIAGMAVIADSSMCAQEVHDKYLKQGPLTKQKSATEVVEVGKTVKNKSMKNT